MEQRSSEINIIAKGKHEESTVILPDHYYYCYYGKLEEGERSVLIRQKKKKQQRQYVSTLSPPQMEALSALCDTYLPSINNDFVSDQDRHDAIRKFLHTSPSMVGTPLIPLAAWRDDQ